MSQLFDIQLSFRSAGSFSAYQKAQHKKNEQGNGPCSENCVDPFIPANSDLIFFGGVTLLAARQGSSRDLDHQTSVAVSLRLNW